LKVFGRVGTGNAAPALSEGDRLQRPRDALRVRFGWRIQPVNATVWLNISAGVRSALSERLAPWVLEDYPPRAALTWWATMFVLADNIRRPTMTDLLLEAEVSDFLEGLAAVVQPRAWARGLADPCVYLPRCCGARARIGLVVSTARAANSRH
jgi:hypothetical protein